MTPFNPQEEDDPWYPIQLFAALAGHVSGDEEAQESLANALNRNLAEIEAKSWLAIHLFLANRLAQVITSPLFVEAGTALC